MPSFELENHIYKTQKSQRVVGIDEVGCGPWAGPLVSVACFLNPEQTPNTVLDLLQDSKKLTHKKRLIAYDALMELSKNRDTCDFGVGRIDVKELDHLGLAKSIKESMARAVQNLTMNPDYILVDGNRDPRLPHPTVMVVKGDNTSFCIAAASIIAKITRDLEMQALHHHYPQYHFDANAGYGTKHHQNALAEFGITPHHRTSYAPIKRIMEGG